MAGSAHAAAVLVELAAHVRRAILELTSGDTPIREALQRALQFWRLFMV